MSSSFTSNELSSSIEDKKDDSSKSSGPKASYNDKVGKKLKFEIDQNKDSKSSKSSAMKQSSSEQSKETPISKTSPEESIHSHDLSQEEEDIQEEVRDSVPQVEMVIPEPKPQVKSALKQSNLKRVVTISSKVRVTDIDGKEEVTKLTPLKRVGISGDADDKSVTVESD